ncbi:phage tail protein [Comamonas sp. JNW]|uniref:phage tail protein n=1 Tax=Comamonas sp. JNW TaxID=2170731 RepID=UPI000DE67BC9|nr:phage tail protein [Comamonas sp. JNW]PWB15612.1 oxidoreductase [Comamonas sp. JNW]
MMAALGQFVFGLSTLAYIELQRSQEWRHPSSSRVGDRPARQYVGPGDDKITLTGLQVPEFMGDRKALDRLADMADAGMAYNLFTGNDAMGAWIIESINTTRTVFIREGAARKVEFTLSLARVDAQQVDPSGGLDTGPDSGAGDNDWYAGDPWDWWLNGDGEW